jgi:hypothetical protein
MDRRVHKNSRCEARESTTILQTSDQSLNHATTTKIQFIKVPGACSRHQGNIHGPDGTT